MKTTRFLVGVFAVATLGVMGETLWEQIVRAPVAESQAPPTRIITENLTITGANVSVADLGFFPDGATKLVLRDGGGRVGLILAVSNAPGRSRAQIQFYDAQQRLVGTLDGTAGPSRQLPALQSVPSGGRGKFDAANPEDIRGLQTQIDMLTARLNATIQRVNLLSGGAS